MEEDKDLENQGFLCKNHIKKNAVLNCIITVFHTGFLIHHVFTISFGICIIINNFFHANVHLRFMIQYSPTFGTNWNLLFQTIFLSLSLLYDVLEWLDKHHTDFGKKLQYYRDITFSGLVVPFTLFISAMFWTVYSIDRELVFPEVYDQIVPWWFNHCVHTNITIVVLVETILQARRYPRNRRLELALVTLIGVLYAIVYYSIYFITHRWLYGVFGIMTWWQVCLYQLLIWASAFIFYFLQFPINRIFHREEAAEEQKNTEGEKTTNGVETNVEAESSPSKSWSLKYRSARTENSKL